MPDRTTMKAAPRTLVEGQRLDQPTFHALYEAMPPGTRAELIDGVVAVVELGCATPEHAAFVVRLAEPRAPS
jgi:hypothetical protein